MAGSEPAALQWTLAYTPTDITSISAAAGASALATGKSITCASSGAGSYTCILAGLNSIVMLNGVVAAVTVTLAPGVSSTAIGITNTLGASADGSAMAVNGSGGTVTAVTQTQTVVSSLSCQPTSLNSGGTSNCIVSLNQSAPTSATVALSSNTAALTVPGSVTVSAGSSSANFTATAGNIAADQTAVITATYNGTPQTASISLLAPTLLSLISCNPTTLSSNGTSSCSVILSKVAGSSGALVTLSSNAAALTVPVSVTVSAGSSSANFTATAGNITADQTAVITATYNGTPQTAAISLLAPTLLSLISCNPTTLSSNGTSNCTVTMSKATGSGGALVTLSSTAAALTVPASVTVSAGSSSANFTATAGNIAADQTAVITATYNGASQTVSISLLAPTVPSLVSCSPTSLSSNATASCSVTLSKAAGSGGALVTLLSNAAALTVPASVTVSAGSMTANFTATTGNIAGGQSAVIKATYNGGSQTATLNLLSNLPVLSLLSCSANTLNAGATTTCTVTLSTAAGAGAAVSLSSNKPSLTVPATLAVAAGSTSATFAAAAGTVTADQVAAITATYSGVSQSTSISLLAPAVLSLVSCSPTSLGSGGISSCTVTLSKPAASGGAAVALSSNAAALTVPASVTVSAGSSSANFTATAANITADQTAAITGTYNSISQAVSISLTAPAVLSLVSCSPTSLGPGGISSCTVTLSKPAGSGGAAVALSSNAAALTVPASVTVSAGSSGANFTATAGNITTDQTAVVTAAYNGSSFMASIALVTATVVSQVSCMPAIVSSGGTSTCTLTFSKPVGSGGASVALSNNVAALSIPATVSVPAGSTNASFTATAATISSNQTATITTSYNGGSKSVSLSLTMAAGPASMTCTPPVLSSGAAAACTVVLTQAAGSGGATIAITSNNKVLTVPGNVVVPAGLSSAVFTANVGAVSSTQPATITASFNGSSVSSTVSLQQQATIRVVQANCDLTPHISNSTVNCIYILSAPAPGSPVLVPTVASDNAALTPLVNWAQPGSTTGTFQLHVSDVSADQIANVTVSAGGAAATVIVNLSGPARLNTMVCNSAALAPGSTVNCTVILNRQLGAESVSISLTGAPDVSVPLTLTISPGLSSTTFTAQVKPVPANSTVVLTASLNGVSRSFTLSATPPGISSLTCAPANLDPGATATCIVSLTAAAVGNGIVLSLTSGNSDLTIPPTLAVAPGSTTASFSATSGSPVADEQATVLVALGASSQITTLTLLGAPKITSFSCSPTALQAGATAQCTVSLSRSAGDSLVVVTSAGAANGLSLPGSVVVPAGSTSAGFSVTASEPGGNSFQITVTLGNSNQSVTIDVGQSAINTLSCNPDFNGAGILACTVALAQAAVSDATVTLQTDSSQIQIPAQIRIPAGARSAQFAATVPVSDQDQRFEITAAMQGAVRSIPFAVIGIRPTRLFCMPVAVHAGDPLTCTVRLTASNVPGIARLKVSSENASLKFPTLITTRPGQTDLSFNVSTDALAPQQPFGIIVGFGQSQAASIVTMIAGVNPILTFPGRQNAIFGNTMSFTVTATDPNAMPLTLSVANLPAGANFDPNTGSFSWMPDQSQQGTYTVTFTAANTAGGTASGDVVIQVDAGKPVITDIRNGASQSSGNVCSPGSVATLIGRWLASANPPVSDPTGASNQLGGAQVNINGAYAPVLYASPTRIDFGCPVADPGTALNISVENGAGITDPVQVLMQPIAPSLFSADGSGQGQGLVTLSGTSLLVMPRTYLNTGQPAEPGDSINILATGIGAAGGLPQIKIGDLFVTADAVQTIASMAGVYQIIAKVPYGLPTGDALPLLVQVTAPDGTVVNTNTVTIAIESGRQ